MSSLLPGRIPMWPKEAEGVEKLLGSLGLKAPDGSLDESELSDEEKAYLSKSITICRAEPNEKGPLQVEVDGEVWFVAKNGKVSNSEPGP